MNKIFHFCVMALAALVAAGLPLGCGSSKSSPSSPSSPAPTFNYALDYFFGSSGPETLYAPQGIRLSGGLLWVGNNGPNSLQAWTTGGAFSDSVTQTWSGSSFGGPSGIGIGPDGYVYVSDIGNEQVEVFNSVGHGYLNFGHTQLGGDYPEGVAVNSTYVYVVDYPGAQVIRFTISGTGAFKSYVSPVTFGTISTSGTLGTLSTPTNVNLDSQGNVYVADHTKQAIMKYNYAGVFQAAVTAPGLTYPADVAFDGSGNLYVPDEINQDVQVISASGAAVTTFGSASTLNDPDGVVLDSSDNCYVLCENQIVVFNKQ